MYNNIIYSHICFPNSPISIYWRKIEQSFFSHPHLVFADLTVSNNTYKYVDRKEQTSKRKKERGIKIYVPTYDA